MRASRRILSAALSLAFVTLGGLSLEPPGVVAASQGTSPGTSLAELPTYRIRAWLDGDLRRMGATQEVEVVNRWESPLREATFVLLPNAGREPNPDLAGVLKDQGYLRGFEPKELEILEVTGGAGQALQWRYEAIAPFMQTYSLDRILLVVELPEPLAPGDRTVLRIAFRLRVPAGSPLGMGDESVTAGVFTWRFLWNPALVAPGALSTQEFRYPAGNYEQVELFVPEQYVVASGADLQEEQPARPEEWRDLAALVNPKAAGAGPEPAGGEPEEAALAGAGAEAQTPAHKRVVMRNKTPRRSVPLSISPDFRSFTLDAGGVPITSYYLPGDEHAARVLATYAAEALAFFSERFGPYAFSRLALVENPNAGYGMAVEGMVLLTQNAYGTANLLAPGLFDRLMAHFVGHEVGHLWWGIGVWPDFNRENWMSEAFAQYAAYRFFEDRYGDRPGEPNLLDPEHPELLAGVVRSMQGDPNYRESRTELTYLNLLRDRMDEPILQPMAETQYLNGLTARTYEKGYLVLRALEGVVGRQTMDSILREAYGRWVHGDATVEAFRQLAESVSGQDLGTFFEQWLYGAATLDYAVLGLEVEEAADRPGSVQATARLASYGEASTPVTVRFTSESGETAEAVWTPGGPGSRANPVTGSVQVEMGQRPVRVAVDPESMVPDANRFDNHWPRKIAFGPESRFSLDTYFVRWYPVFGLQVQAAETGDPQQGSPSQSGQAQLATVTVGSGIAGGFRNDHAWTLVSAVEYDAATNRQNPVVAASGAVDLGRGGYAGGKFNLRGLEWSGELALGWAAWVPRPIGAAGRYLYPVYPVQVAIGRHNKKSLSAAADAEAVWSGTAASGGIQEEGPVNYASLRAGYNEFLNRGLVLTVGALGLFAEGGTSETGASTGLRLETILQRAVRLFPGTRLDLEASGQHLFGEAPPSLRPAAVLRSRAVPLQGETAGTLAAKFELPLLQTARTRLFNLAVVESVVLGTFLEAGGAVEVATGGSEGAGGAGEARKTRYQLGAGADVTLGLWGPFLTPLAVQVGVGVPIVASDRAPGAPVQPNFYARLVSRWW